MTRRSNPRVGAAVLTTLLLATGCADAPVDVLDGAAAGSDATVTTPTDLSQADPMKPDFRHKGLSAGPTCRTPDVTAAAAAAQVEGSPPTKLLGGFFTDVRRAADHASYLSRRNAALHGEEHYGGFSWDEEKLPVAPVALCWFEGTFQTEVEGKTMPRAVIHYDLSDRSASPTHIASVEALPVYPPAPPADNVRDRIPAGAELAPGRP